MAKFANYYQDKRTKEEYEKNIRDWKKAEAKIIERLESYFGVEHYDDDFTTHSPYKQDIDMWYWWREWKVEIKYTKAKMINFQWKKNQADKAMKENIFCIYVAWGKIWWTDPTWRHKEIPEEESYCNKPVYEYRPIWFKNFEELFKYLTK